jgi:hypothetical protein
MALNGQNNMLVISTFPLEINDCEDFRFYPVAQNIGTYEICYFVSGDCDKFLGVYGLCDVVSDIPNFREDDIVCEYKQICYNSKFDKPGERVDFESIVRNKWAEVREKCDHLIAIADAALYGQQIILNDSQILLFNKYKKDLVDIQNRFDNPFDVVLPGLEFGFGISYLED